MNWPLGLQKIVHEIYIGHFVFELKCIPNIEMKTQNSKLNYKDDDDYSNANANEEV